MFQTNIFDVQFEFFVWLMSHLLTGRGAVFFTYTAAGCQDGIQDVSFFFFFPVSGLNAVMADHLTLKTQQQIVLWCINYNTEHNVARVQIRDMTLAQKLNNCLCGRKKCLPKPIELQNQHCQLEQNNSDSLETQSLCKLNSIKINFNQISTAVKKYIPIS